MQIGTMRKVDKWVGIPLCFLASPICWISDTLRGSRKKAPDTKRTLFIELSEMGSAVIVDPSMRKLRTEAKAELFFAIFKANKKSLNLLSTIPEENIFSMNAKNFFTLVIDVFRFLIWCRRKKITCVIDLELFSRFTALLSFLSGAGSRIGFASFHDEGLYRGNLINYPVRYNAHVHIAVNFVSLVNRAMHRFTNPYATVPLAVGDLQLARAKITNDEKKVVVEKIKSVFPFWTNEEILLFNVNASDMLPQRRWLRENFAIVASDLLNSLDNVLILATGSDKEYEYVQEFVNLTNNPRCKNAAGLFEFRELVPLYAVSKLMLTNDSGPAHFAAVTPLKVFVLFGPETPNLYLPLGGNAEPFYLGLPCSPCVSAANHRKTSCETRPCITGIQPAWVFTRLSWYLKNESVAANPQQEILT